MPPIVLKNDLFALEEDDSDSDDDEENELNVGFASIRMSRPLRLAVWMTAAMALVGVGFLAVLAAPSSHVDWWSKTELQHSIKFLQHNADTTPSPETPSANVTITNDSPITTSFTHPKGIVLCLHDRIASMGVSLIRELRCLGNTDPIQVYHCFDDELSSESRDVILKSDANVEIIDVCSQYLNNAHMFNGEKKKAIEFRNYWIKPLALLHSSFREVILLDADAILLRDPGELRQSNSGYTRTGTIFFHDRIHSMRKFFNAQVKSGEQLLKHILRTFDVKRLGLPKHTPSTRLQSLYAYKEESAHEMDSSMVFIDKGRAGKALNVLLELALRERFKYQFSWGDKEAFWLAYELAQQDYFFSPWGLSLIDSVPSGDLAKHPSTLCGSMAHFVPTEDESSVPELLYVNGKALIDPIPVEIKKIGSVPPSRLYNVNPTRVTPRYSYATFDLATRKTFECLDGLGSTALPQGFHKKLFRRRHHYMAAEMRLLESMDRCDV